MSWRLHTQTNVSIEAGGTAATLSAATGAAVRLEARVERCPQARLRLSPGVGWGPPARTWTGCSALLLEANTTATFATVVAVAATQDEKVVSDEHVHRHALAVRNTGHTI